MHLILTPADPAGLGLAMSRARRLYAGFVNARARQTGHLFQGRFGSVPMDEEHLIAAVRYVALNPVRARLVAKARDWPHSSARAHLKGRDDGLVRVRGSRSGRAFCRSVGYPSRRPRLRSLAALGIDWTAARIGKLHEARRGAARANPRAGQTRPEAEVANTAVKEV